MIDWMHSGPSVAAAFIGSSVEAIEALTIVLAVGTVRGWRSALMGTAVGLALLAAIVLMFGPAIALVPIDVLRIVVGTLLLLFGFRWLRKAILRSAGVIALHDEDAAFTKETQVLNREPSSRQRWDPVAIITAFKAVVLEGIEVVVIVIGVGAVGNMLIPASLGALMACLAGYRSRRNVAPPAVAHSRKLAQIHGRHTDFGFWHVLVWRRYRRFVALPGCRDNRNCRYPAAGVQACGRSGAARRRRESPHNFREAANMKTLSTIGRELFGLFVDDGSLAQAILALLAVTALLAREASIDVSQAAVLLVAGSIIVLLENVGAQRRK